MSKANVTKYDSRIYAHETDGNPIPLQGKTVGFIQVPAGMDGTELTFKGCFNDGMQWFVVLDSAGQPLRHSTRWTPRPIPAQEAQTLNPAPVTVPVPQWDEFFEGIQFLIPVSNKPESQDRLITFYLVD
jgi:hypothetical protein